MNQERRRTFKQFRYINNKEVKDGEGGISIKTDDSTSVLTIHSFNPDIHVGEIICKAENQVGAPISMHRNGVSA